MSARDLAWHPAAIGPATRRALRGLRGCPSLKPFYLAGGTGLALRLGHRVSVDLDFFTPGRVDPDCLLRELRSGFGRVKAVALDSGTLHVHADSVKVSFLGYPYPQLYPFGHFENVAVADPRDIACMKLSAISGRGTRRDFVDLFAIAQIYGLATLLSLFDRKYAGVTYSRIHLLKSLTYFEEANQEGSPNLPADLDWEAVKRFFEDQVVLLYRSLDP